MLEAVHALQSRRALTLRSPARALLRHRSRLLRPAARSVPMGQGTPRAKHVASRSGRVNSATSTHSTSYARIGDAR
eukprot:4318273-Prymnesium_polylepis.1